MILFVSLTSPFMDACHKNIRMTHYGNGWMEQRRKMLNQVKIIEERVLDALQPLKVGEDVVIPCRGGWQMVITRCEVGYDITHHFPVPVPVDSKELTLYKFFEYTTVGNQYGAGMIVEEPSLGILCRNVRGLDIDGYIVGAIVMSEADEITGRYSLSNLVFAKGQTFSISEDGELVVNDVLQGFVDVVFLANKNRLVGYVCVCIPAKIDRPVEIVEMEHLVRVFMRARR